MKLVIDIPKEDYDIIKNDGLYSTFSGEMKRWGLAAIRNGTPLPKVYGRLIDYGYVVDAIDDWVNAEEYRYTNATD